MGLRRAQAPEEHGLAWMPRQGAFHLWIAKNGYPQVKKDDSLGLGSRTAPCLLANSLQKRKGSNTSRRSFRSQAGNHTNLLPRITLLNGT